jgi:4-hydroxy-tetrahydrodipicolinate synthase
MSPNFLRFPLMFNGSIAALVTPFTEQGGIDLAAVAGLVDFHCMNGSDGLVIAGTTGESATLSRGEFRDLLRTAVRKANGRLPIYAGTGSPSTATTMENMRVAAGEGADAALVVTPYYNRPTQSGLEAHFRSIADAAELEFLLYNVPSRTAVDIQPSTVERLSGHARIAGIKEAVPDPARIEELCARCGPDFAVLSGDDNSCLEAMKHGAVGVVSVAANVVPELMQQLHRDAMQQDWLAADELQLRLKALFDVLMIETNPIPVKWALFEMGLIGSVVRLPLTQLNTEFQATLRHCLVDQQLIQA